MTKISHSMTNDEIDASPYPDWFEWLPGGDYRPTPCCGYVGYCPTSCEDDDLDGVHRYSNKVICGGCKTVLRHRHSADWMQRGTVFTNGVFLIVHVGHVRLLEWAKSQGSRLVVAINSDASATRLKGSSRSIVPAAERAEILRMLRAVDEVVIFDNDTPEQEVKRLRPEVLVKGPEERGRVIVGAAFVESYGGRVAIPDWPIEHSTSGIIERIRGQ